MLLELNLKNFILIEDISLSFEEGLTILTGETGAGKSILLEGLRICLGSRTSKDYLRDPNQKAVFEMILSTEEELLSITREIFPSGKALSRLDGEIVNVEILQEKVAPYLDIYGQKDHFRMLEPAWQRQLLHRFSGKVEPILQDISRTRESMEECLQEEEKLTSLLGTNLDQERFFLRELEALGIDLERDRFLEEEFFRLQHQAEIQTHANAARGILEEEILPGILRLERELEALSRVGQSNEEIGERLEEVRLELQDLLSDLQRESVWEGDESELLQMEERFQELHRLQRKHQRDLPELLHWQEELSEKIEQAERAQDLLARNELKKKTLFNTWSEQSERLKSEEETVFKRLRDRLLKELEEMSMKGARLELVHTPRRETGLYPLGSYQMEFYASISGREPGPLRDVLSGGETSRLILALKTVFSEQESTQTMVFDEIDTGISGKVAFRVGKLIHRLSLGRQVIAITHLPQLASFADRHYVITKNDRTTQVLELSEKEQLHRLAVMMTGEDSPAALASAQEIRRRAEEESI